MSSNIFDLFNSSKILDKHGKKIHLKIAKGSITWDKLGDDVKRRILGIEANIDSLYNYVRQLVPDMNYHSVTLVEAVGIRYIDNHQSIIIDGQNYSIIVEAKEHYNLSDVIVTIGSDAYSLSDIESMEDKFTVDSYTETRLSFTILNVTDNIRIEGVAEEEEGSLVSLEAGEGYKWVDDDDNDASSFYARYNEENTYYIVITDSGKSFDEIEGENCSAVAGEEEDGKIPVTIKQVTGDARVFVSLANNTVSVRTNNANPNFRVLIDDNEVTLPQSVSIGSTHIIKVEPNTNYYFNTAPTSDGEIVFTSNGDGSYSHTFKGIQEDIVIYGNAIEKPKVSLNNVDGYDVTVNNTQLSSGNIHVEPASNVTIVCTLQNISAYEETKPYATYNSQNVNPDGTNPSSPYTITINNVQGDIVVYGKAYEENGIYWGEYQQQAVSTEADFALIQADLTSKFNTLVSASKTAGRKVSGANYDTGNERTFNNTIFIAYPDNTSLTVELTQLGSSTRQQIDMVNNGIKVTGISWNGKNYTIWEMLNLNAPTVFENIKFYITKNN